jgi:hypothetical protein
MADAPKHKRGGKSNHAAAGNAFKALGLSDSVLQGVMKLGFRVRLLFY